VFILNSAIYTLEILTYADIHEGEPKEKEYNEYSDLVYLLPRIRIQEEEHDLREDWQSCYLWRLAWRSWVFAVQPTKVST